MRQEGVLLVASCVVLVTFQAASYAAWLSNAQFQGASYAACFHTSSSKEQAVQHAFIHPVPRSKLCSMLPYTQFQGASYAACFHTSSSKEQAMQHAFIHPVPRSKLCSMLSYIQFQGASYAACFQTSSVELPTRLPCPNGATRMAVAVKLTIENTLARGSVYMCCAGGLQLDQVLLCLYSALWRFGHELYMGFERLVAEMALHSFR
jgi:hypothetical protein